MEAQTKQRNSFTGSVGFVMATAGSAVGLGNIWRFPYLAARDGGGLFLLVYIAFAVTFGFTLLITEIAIGRRTQESPLTAYKKLSEKWKFLGVFSFIIPFIILSYYNVIGGWVLKYTFSYLTFQGKAMVADDYLSRFIALKGQPILFMVLFAFLTFGIVYKGVAQGIEKYSKILMPILAAIVVFMAFYPFFISHADEPGVTRTGLQGLAMYFIPDFSGLTLEKFFDICLDATGQLFYSLSISMGILIAYGSYMKKDVNLGKSVNMIEVFDTGIAILSGMLIIPAVYVFSGKGGMSAGPGLIFVTLPKVFNSFGKFGSFLGIIFFVMVTFAALTSSVSLLEAITSSIMDKFKWSRKRSVITMALLILAVSLIICLGYNVFYFEVMLPNGAKGQILDILDYLGNNLLMPIVGILTCVLIGWIVKPKAMVDEITLNGEKFKRRTLYVVMIRFFAPVLLFIIFLTGLGIL